MPKNEELWGLSAKKFKEVTPRDEKRPLIILSMQIAELSRFYKMENYGEINVQKFYRKMYKTVITVLWSMKQKIL